MLDPKVQQLVMRRHLDLRRGMLADALPYDLRWAEKSQEPEAGMWRLNEDTHRHEITLNESLDRYAERHDALARFAMNVYHHEVAHSIFTDPDGREIFRGLRAGGLRVPFPLLNLFEDARIEARWRALTGQAFHWTRWLLPPWEGEGIRRSPLCDVTPGQWFHHFVTLEGDDDAIEDTFALVGKRAPSLVPRVRRVLWYYRRATHLHGVFGGSTAALVPLCRHWVRQFGRSPREMQWLRRMRGIHGDDVSRILKRARQALRPGLDDELEEIFEHDIPPSMRRLLRRKSHGGSESDADGNGDEIWETDCNRGDLDLSVADAVEASLRRAFEGGMEKGVKSIFPKKRFSTRDYIRGSARIYRGRSETPTGQKNLMLMLDCSGSMRGDAALNGLTFLQVINRLHRKGRLRARVFLTYGPNVELKLPFPEEKLLSLASIGSIEGFERCLREHEDAVRWADLVCVYTDGNITDDPIDPGRWKRLRTPAYGLYAGKDCKKRERSLGKWFTRTLARPTLQELITDLVGMVRTV